MPGLVDRLAELADVLAGAAVLAELLLDLLHLLAQQHLALTLIDRTTRLLLDLALQPQHFDAMGQVLGDAVETRLEIDRLQDLLPFGRLHVHEARHHVGERARRFDGLHRVGELARRARQQRDRLARQALEIECEGLDFARRGGRIGEVFDACHEERHPLLEVEHAEAPLALDDEVMPAIRCGDIAENRGFRAEAV